VLRALLVERVAAHEVLARRAGRPLAKAHAPMGIDPIADRNDRVAAVVLELPLHLPLPFHVNC
jgi:hypothetical protein